MNIQEDHVPRRKLKGQIITNRAKRKSIFEEKGCRCAGCHSTEGQMILHHVVPISKGGLDDPSNIVVLCEKCHAAVHDISLNSLRKPFKNSGGRPRTCSAEDEEKYYWQYVRCEIGTKELKEKIHTKPSVAICDRPGFKEFIAKHKIKSYKNNIDMANSRGRHLEDGQLKGFIIFEDGTQQEFYHSEPKKPAEEIAPEAVPESVPETTVNPKVEIVENEVANRERFNEREMEIINSSFRNMNVAEFERWMFTNPRERENSFSHGA